MNLLEVNSIEFNWNTKKKKNRHETLQWTIIIVKKKQKTCRFNDIRVTQRWCEENNLFTKMINKSLINSMTKTNNVLLIYMQLKKIRRIASEYLCFYRNYVTKITSTFTARNICNASISYDHNDCDWIERWATGREYNKLKLNVLSSIVSVISTCLFSQFDNESLYHMHTHTVAHKSTRRFEIESNWKRGKQLFISKSASLGE